ncbi:MAG: ribosome recycling factor [Candidatus Spechtbacteria bacterium SB0662_bin_43]|uniref:Ribosome-recycling factor n=1 Tax=Candidatus Spechtbacteria bacterium SB0662_bin_43 TaxID=2604897 RepID=A0A845DE28_9BACT|nr:ribosome recycling factor [Candidatus Spechtbacteria bacterium SB0662_bin_43]
MTKTLQEKIQKTIEIFETTLRSVRAGRANSGLVEHLVVDAYGSQTPLSHIASIQVPQNDQIVIQAWDAALVPSIEKALRSSDLGVNPVVDGSLVRIVLPPLTHERRMEFVKMIRRHAEEARITIRNIREQATSEIEKEFHDNALSEDEKFQQRDSIQKDVDKANKTIQEMLKKKEDDIVND